MGEITEQVGTNSRKKFSFDLFLHRHCPFLFEIRSLFYFFWFVFFLGMLWMAYGLFTNSFTQFYPWTDYFGQYVTMGYYFHDTWRGFFKTGYFELYSFSTYLGSDNIGSNSYYGLFDPFLFFCYLFPRAWIPQTFAIATMLKGVAGAFATRAYLKYLGVKEFSARIGAVAFAFNGYINFMVGFPSFVSMAFTVPLIFYGIEMVIREKKITWLVIGLALLGMISFFFLVVVCIFGVIYAMFRYFQTIKGRGLKDNLWVICYGVIAFALGIAMSAWTLFPSLRESALSGRTTSIAKAYLNSLSSAFKGMDVITVFALLFEMVGRHPVREMQAIIGFFYPTIGYRYSALAGGGYDAWTASLFCYTPFVLLTFIALVDSCRQKKVSHIIAWLLIGYALFTNFSYYFFYAFTGDGYGRWYIVLIPIIIYYGAQEIDRLKDNPKWVIAAGEGIAITLSVLTWVLCVTLVRNVSFDNRMDGYWQTTYKVPYEYVYQGITRSFLWVIYLQILLVFLEGVIFLAWQKKAVLKRFVLASVAIETVLWGNVSFVDNHPWRVDDKVSASGKVISSGWNGGNAYREEATAGVAKIKESDPSFYRTFFEGNPENNAAMAFGSNGLSTFHSLFNYDVNQLSLYLHANRPTYRNTQYAYGEDYYSHSWSAFYGNKRFGADNALNIKYYAVLNQGYGEWEGIADNVPWNHQLVYGDDSSKLRFYVNNDALFGHAVDKVYKQNVIDEMCGYDAFYRNSGEREVQRNDQVLFEGAIVSDKDIKAFEKEFEGTSVAFLETPAETNLYQKVNYSMSCYKTDYEWWGPSKAGPTYFLSDPNKTSRSISLGSKYIPDYETVVLTPTDGYLINGERYFNEDPTGAYISLNYDFGTTLLNIKKTRVYLIGDVYEDDGITLKDENKDVMLSYDYETMATYAKRKMSGGSDDDIFGFYPKGRVKYVCFNAKPSDFTSNDKDSAVASLPSKISLYVAERKDLSKKINAYKNDGEYALKDVSYDKNKFTFATSFSSKRVVVTSIGYDEGWKLIARKDDKETVLNAYKLNGGFVGFVAPEGEVTYTLKYETPYLKEGALAAAFAIFAFGAIQISTFIYYCRKRKGKSADN